MNEANQSLHRRENETPDFQDTIRGDSLAQTNTTPSVYGEASDQNDQQSPDSLLNHIVDG